MVDVDDFAAAAVADDILGADVDKLGFNPSLIPVVEVDADDVDDDDSAAVAADDDKLDFNPSLTPLVDCIDPELVKDPTLGT